MQARASLTECIAAFGVDYMLCQQLHISLDIGWLDLVAGREPRSTGVLGELAPERPDLDDKKAVDVRADAQNDR